jgi:hypothetical protein
MWAKWTNFYNRAKSANADLSLFERVGRLCAYIFGSAVLAWASRTWDWYWNTFSWAGVAFAFLVSWIGIALAIFLGGLGMYLWRNKKLNARTDGNTQEALACHPPTLCDAIVVAGAPSGKAPEFRARFARNGHDASFWIEYSMCTPHGWTEIVKRHAYLKDRFVRKETVSFPLIEKITFGREELWRFKTSPAFSDDGMPIDMVGRERDYQGRVVTIIENTTEEFCYFIVSFPASADAPQVTGQHMFDHMFKWEGKSVPTGDASSLFK